MKSEGQNFSGKARMLALAAAVLLALAACRDKGTADADVGSVSEPAAQDPAPAPQTPISEVQVAVDPSQLVDVFDGTALAINGRLRSRSESPEASGGTRRVVRVEYFYESQSDAIQKIAADLRGRGFRVAVAEDLSTARVISPAGLKGSVAAVSSDGDADLKMNNPDARGMISFFWISPVVDP